MIFAAVLIISFAVCVVALLLDWERVTKGER